MTGEINLRKLALDRKIPYQKLWRKVNLNHLPPQEAIDAIEKDMLFANSPKTSLEEFRDDVAKEKVGLYHLRYKDVVRALNSLPEEWDNSPLFLGWPMSYWTNNNTEYAIVMHMLGNNYSMEEIIKITGIRLKLHNKIRGKR